MEDVLHFTMPGDGEDYADEVDESDDHDVITTASWQ
jgi:hypothetical protein